MREFYLDVGAIASARCASRHTFPLGLVRHSVVIDKSEVLLVHPRLGELKHDWSRELRENAGGSQAACSVADCWKPIFTASNCAGRQPPLDPLARRPAAERWSCGSSSSVVAKTWHCWSTLWQPAEPSEQQLENVETAITFVATVIAQACRKPGHNLILSLAWDTSRCMGGAGLAMFFRDQMDALAMAAPHHEDPFPPALGHTLALVAPSTPTLIVSTRPIDWEALRRLAAQRDVPLLAERLVQSVNVASDELDRYFRSERGGVLFMTNLQTTTPAANHDRHADHDRDD